MNTYILLMKRFLFWIFITHNIIIFYNINWCSKECRQTIRNIRLSLRTLSLKIGQIGYKKCCSYNKRKETMLFIRKIIPIMENGITKDKSFITIITKTKYSHAKLYSFIFLVSMLMLTVLPTLRWVLLKNVPLIYMHLIIKTLGGPLAKKGDI